MRRMLVVYDDREKPGEEIRRVVGNVPYGKVILKRRAIFDRYRTVLESAGLGSSVFELREEDQLPGLAERLEQARYEDAGVLHIFSDVIVRDEAKAKVVLEKARFMLRPTAVLAGRRAALYINPTVDGYIEWLNQSAAWRARGEDALDAELLESEAFADISGSMAFLRYISSGFDARFFNSMNADQYTVTKHSANVKKIRAEYQMYALLPDLMKSYFVMPYDYREDERGARYAMQRYHIADLAVRFVHGAVSPEEFGELLDEVFHFLAIRVKKTVSAEEGAAVARELYEDKLRSRIRTLKEHKAYPGLAACLAAGTGQTIDDIEARYLKLLARFQKRRGDQTFLSVSHGDLCFSNMLYHQGTRLLRLIDPKGATREDQLYSNPYYDVAKLSHSIAGRYDFFNNGLYAVRLGRDLKLKLELAFDNRAYAERFLERCGKEGFDPWLVRLYEASLFLSMLPLHMDDPAKVLAFILNALDILNEVERHV